MISHDAFRRLAAAALDGPLSPEEATQLAIHSADCDACRTFQRALEADAAALAQPASLQVPAALDARIEAVLAGGERHGPSAVLVLLAAALLLAAAIGAIAAGSLLENRRDASRLPDRPALPAGWHLVMADSRDIRLALPNYVEASWVDGSILANAAPGSSGTPSLEVVAFGGPSLPAQPADGQSVEDWLLAGMPTRDRGPVTVRRVALPAGMATEVSFTIGASTPDETLVVVYAVPSRDGYSTVQLNRPVERVNEHRDDVALIPYFIEVGPALTAAIGPPPVWDFEFQVPTDWTYAPAPDSAQAPDLRWIGYISNQQLTDLCDLNAGRAGCADFESSLAPGTFLARVVRFDHGTPAVVPASSPLPDGATITTVAGVPGVRRVESSPPGGVTHVRWEFEAPENPAGFFSVLLSARPEDDAQLNRWIARIDDILASATFVREP
jgi:hypothetical protein